MWLVALAVIDTFVDNLSGNEFFAGTGGQGGVSATSEYSTGALGQGTDYLDLSGL